jgi:transposase
MSRKTDAVFARTIGIDTGKNTLHLIGLDDKGAIVLREKLTRGRIAARLANVPQCLIGIEAGMATHCVARDPRSPCRRRCPEAAAIAWSGRRSR